MWCLLQARLGLGMGPCRPIYPHLIESAAPRTMKRQKLGVVTWPPLQFDIEQVASSNSGSQLASFTTIVSRECLKQKTLDPL